MQDFFQIKFRELLDIKMVRVCVCSSGGVFTSVALNLVAGMKNQNSQILTLSVLVSTELLVTLSHIFF